METFKKACKEYLNTISIDDLRRYGRYVGLQRPTDMKKQALIDEIIAMLCGEKSPSRNCRGAPIKNNGVLESIPLKIEQLRKELLGYSVKNIESPTEKFIDVESTVVEEPVVVKLSLPFQRLNEEQKKLVYALLESLDK